MLGFKQWVFIDLHVEVWILLPKPFLELDAPQLMLSAFGLALVVFLGFEDAAEPNAHVRKLLVGESLEQFVDEGGLGLPLFQDFGDRWSKEQVAPLLLQLSPRFFSVPRCLPFFGHFLNFSSDLFHVGPTTNKRTNARTWGNALLQCYNLFRPAFVFKNKNISL